MLIRPANSNDIGALLALARESGPGMTNFNDNKQAMVEKIEQTTKSFSRNVESPDDEYYFFVLEDPETARIVGCCGIFSTVGIHRPFYSFRVLNLTHTSMEIEFYEPVRVLQMVEEHRGFAEIVSLYLTPDYRKDNNGKLLSRSRFLFMAEFRKRFPEFVIAEMRGRVDEDGQSAFWDSLGGHFFPMNFIEADQFNALGHFQFISDMMPKYPIYIRLLPEKAQAMIGKTHEHTLPALKMLEKEGFRNDGCVDVFDAGPVIKCPVDEIKTSRDSRTAIVTEITSINEQPDSLICNSKVQDFRLTRGQLIQGAENAVTIDSLVASRLNLSKGDQIRFVRF